MTISDNLTEEFWRAAAVAWGCFVIGVYCFRVALGDPQRRSRLIGQLLSRGLILCGMLVLTGFGSHAVQEYRQLADRAGGEGPLHFVGETLLAQVQHVDRFKSPDGWEVEFADYGPAGGILRGADLSEPSGFLPAAGRRGWSRWDGGDQSDESATRSAPGSALVPRGSGRSGWPIGERF